MVPLIETSSDAGDTRQHPRFSDLPRLQEAWDSLRLPNPSPAAVIGDAGDAPPNEGRAAVVVVDVQTCWYSQSPTVKAAFPDFGRNMAELLRVARRRGIPLVHLRARYSNTGHAATMRRLNPALNKGGITPEPEPFAAALAGEPVVHKPTFDGFFRTELEGILIEMGVTRILVCGLVTSACVLSTAFGGFSRGFDVLIVEDCCADRSLERHRAVVSLYSDYCFRAVSHADLHRIKCGAPPAAQAKAEAAQEEGEGGGGSRVGAFTLGFQRVSPSSTLDDLSSARLPADDVSAARPADDPTLGTAYPVGELAGGLAGGLAHMPRELITHRVPL